MEQRTSLRLFVAVTLLFLGMAKAGEAGGSLIQNVLLNRSFFVRLNGYDDHFLYDVRRLSREWVGIILLSPSGYEKSLVFETQKGKTDKKIYENEAIPTKSLRETLMRHSIRVSDARALAWQVEEMQQEKTGRRKEVIPPAPVPAVPVKEAESQRNVPVRIMPQKKKGTAQKKGYEDALAKIRNDVRRNSKVAGMSCGEILRRFKADLTKDKDRSTKSLQT